ncbi:MAG: hypothetical protein JRE28_13540 [Deltaproteobacteria bacterium]|nr:hypothetical protein [Deltaproteobacteria bacterium]
MKLIRQYLASLKERDELDAVLPDLLSQIGLNVYSRPGRGTRQDGVDVAAVGSLDGSNEKVYLFSIKAGDLTRSSWDGDSVQSLRPSLNEILDSYIPNRLPNEHKDKDVVVCLCFGGDIQEQVRPQVEGYIKQNERNNLTFEEWNGDKLASMILANFLREDLLPQQARSQLRKSLALLDEPEASYQHFSALIRSLSSIESTKDKDQLTAIRQIIICLWILFSWTRDANNIESAYLSSEFALLHSWKIAKGYFAKTTKVAKDVQLAFQSILIVYQQINSQYLGEKILPHTHKRHALSVAVQPSCNLDVNLKMFDVLGRLAIGGIWAYWSTQRISKDEAEVLEKMWEEVQSISNAIKQLISNNPTLLLPIKDDQGIDIFIATLLLFIDSNNHNDIRKWLSELVERATFANKTNGQYPCNLSSYSELLEHPQQDCDNYHQEVTSGSILFPIIALFASLLGDNDLYNQVQSLKKNHLSHCNFQFWYPDESSETHFYTNSDAHGATLSHACIERSIDEFTNQAFAECSHTPYFETLSAIEYGLWPIVLVACRHYRIPVPLHLMEGLRDTSQLSIVSRQERNKPNKAN